MYGKTRANCEAGQTSRRVLEQYGPIRMNRRTFLEALAAGVLSVDYAARGDETQRAGRRPNLLFVFADQWRAQATGYAGDPNVHTPNLDALAARSVNFINAVSTCPVCSPYRASLLTGQYPHTHGVFLNDVCLRSEAVSFAEALNGAGYDTGYIGKWHLDGHGRSSFIPQERRQGFQFWRAMECTHDYNHSGYYADTDTKLAWEGYDAIAQTREAVRYLKEERSDKPFALFLSWGPPHNPYETAPEEFRRLYTPGEITLRPNVPEDAAEAARCDLAGYYAHCSALDKCLGDLLDVLRELGIEENTLLVFTSDHGDMLGSHGEQRKQRPWDESIRVPLLLHCPALFGIEGMKSAHPISAPDLLPTVLGLCGVTPPASVQGKDLSQHVRGGSAPEDDAALIACYSPFGEWTREKGGREYRGLRTKRYTYVRGLDGPWLLFDNEADPYQRENLCGRPEHAELEAGLEQRLKRTLSAIGDEFLPGGEYVRRWGYQTDKDGTAPYAP